MNSPTEAVCAVFAVVLFGLCVKHVFLGFKASFDYHRKYGSKKAKAESRRNVRAIQECQWRLNGFKSPDNDMWKGRS
jgi:hypothetical protein